MYLNDIIYGKSVAIPANTIYIESNSNLIKYFFKLRKYLYTNMFL